MYYPIIDKLKELVTRVVNVEDNQPYIVNCTVTGADYSGTFSNSWTDIINAFKAGKQVIAVVNQEISGMAAVYISALCSANVVGGDLIPTAMGTNLFIMGSSPAYVRFLDNGTFAVQFVT